MADEFVEVEDSFILEDSENISEGVTGSDVSDDFTAPVNPEIESLTLSIEDYGKITVSSIPVGFLAGAFIMIVGFAILGILKILKSLS